MRLAVSEVLDGPRLAALAELLARGRWVDGRLTAGATAREVKHNLQLDASCPEYVGATTIVSAALADSEPFQSAALPRATSGLLFSRSEAGMGYGPHVDNALMFNPALRTDLAFTLFLSGPDAYEGGELVIMDAEGENSIKLPAGTAYLYPATTLHRVEPVRSGRRDVCDGWIQSLVRDPRVREMLFDLSQAKAQLSRDPAQRALRDLVSKTQSNLLRMHVEL
jgi:PKHD-type hydroxylase